VSPGEYPVDLLVATATRQGELEDQRIACARIVLADKQAVRYEPVLGYAVDNATGCFMDESAARVLCSMSGDEFDEFWRQMRSEEEKVYAPTRSWASLVLDRDTRANIVVFTSGYGDGVYESYVGRDKMGEITSLVTDFGLLFTEQDEQLRAERPWWRFW
jgi:hypothetical protein